MSLPALPFVGKTVPEGLRILATLDGNGTDVNIGEASDGRLMLYAAWEGHPSKPLTPLLSRYEIVCIAEAILGGKHMARVTTWPHATMVMAMAVALLADTLVPPPPPEAEPAVAPKPVPPAPLAGGAVAEPVEVAG